MAGNAIDGTYQAVDTRKWSTKYELRRVVYELIWSVQFPSRTAPAAAFSMSRSKALNGIISSSLCLRSIMSDLDECE